ncbi:unnamed protein product, partial [Protopolystoma xenopodis]
MADLLMDYRKKAPISGKSPDSQKSFNNYCSFFQSPKKRFSNVDPTSAVHLVGPMFELTAHVDRRGGTDDFDAFYPDSALSSTVRILCDHNYALPTGLTPPSMAPHLMDLNIPSKSHSYQEPEKYIPSLSSVVNSPLSRDTRIIQDTVVDSSCTDLSAALASSAPEGMSTLTESLKKSTLPLFHSAILPKPPNLEPPPWASNRKKRKSHQGQENVEPSNAGSESGSISGDGAESIVTGGGISTNNQHRPPPLPIKEGEETEEALADTKRTLFG